MRIPQDAVIARAKLVEYLLKPRPWDDKSGFLARVGFSAQAPEALERAIRRLAAGADAVRDGENDYGIFWTVTGELIGPAGQSLAVALIWMRRHGDGRFHLVTVRPPRRGERRDDERRQGD